MHRFIARGAILVEFSPFSSKFGVDGFRGLALGEPCADECDGEVTIGESLADPPVTPSRKLQTSLPEITDST